MAIIMRFLGFVFVVFTAAGIVIAADAPLVAPTDKAPVLPNRATVEAQKKLVEGLAPVKPKMRFRRALNPPKPAGPLRLPPPPYDLSNTPEGKAGTAELAKIRQNIAKSDWPAEPAPGKERVIFADGSEGKEYEIEYDTGELAALAAKAEARGINNASEENTKRGDAGEALPLIRAGWSNGVDSRVKKSISVTYPVNHRVLRRIGKLDYGCSGTLIGRRLVLTAAHCIVKADLSYNTHAFQARRSGTQMPYGTVTSISYWYAAKWVSNNCHTNRRWDPCSPHDWAVLLLPDNAFHDSPNGHPGSMGYWVYGQNHIYANAVSHNDGYPTCSWSNAPAGCTSDPNQPWGQTAACTATGFKWTVDTVPTYYRIACDMSGGHSGSPNWTDYPGANGPYVIGHAMWSHCFLCDGSQGETEDEKRHPSGFRGMTPYLANFITDKRIAHP